MFLKKTKYIIRKILVKFFPCKLWKMFASSQNEESEYLIKICEEIDSNKSFVEFGFHPFEFNSVNLVKKNYKGLLLDGNKKNCDLANLIFTKLDLNTKAYFHWISIDSLIPIEDFVSRLNGDLGILNIDIDGNDYWILKKLLTKISPEIICVEHNASFGLRNISTPYKIDFNRHAEHKSGWYHSASILAFYNLLSHSYCLVKNISGLNLIFVRKDKMTHNLTSLKPENAYAECVLRNQMSKTDSHEQFDTIKHLNFVQLD